MFPSFEKEVLAALLSANGYHVEHTIEQIFQMESDASASPVEGSTEKSPRRETSTTGSSDTAPAAVTSAAAAGVTAPTIESAPAPTRSLGSPHEPAFPAQRVVSAGGAAGGGDRTLARRGTPTTLPEDFLRPPGWKENRGGGTADTIGDEQLALMLQDEMFRREVQNADGMRAILGRGSATSRTDDQTSGSRTGGGPSSDEPFIPDMGILKGLSSLSSAARANVNGIAQRWIAGKKKSNNTTTEEIDGVSMSLLHSHDPNEEEVIDFQENKKRQ